MNAAYSSLFCHRNGTLLGTRNGDCFTTYDRVEFHSDLNAAKNILYRGLDTEITRFMKYKEVQVVLLRRTALFLNAMGLTLLDAINLGWLDVKHKKCQAFEKIRSRVLGTSSNRKWEDYPIRYVMFQHMYITEPN